VRTGQIGSTAGGWPAVDAGLRIQGSARIVMTCRVGSSRQSAWASTSATASLSVSATATHLQDHDSAHRAAIGVPEVSLYARVRGARRRCATRRRSSRAVSCATARRTARATRPIRSAIVDSVPRVDGPLVGRRTERVSKSEHEPVEVNPPDYCFDHSGVPVRREEIDAPSRALR
jgi:hypothetical protein